MPEATVEPNTCDAVNPLQFDAMLDLDDESFRKIADLIYTRFGINLTDKKRALVRGRLHSLIKAAGLSSFGEYLDYVLEDTHGDRLLQLIDRISTNHTYFFREADHFSYLAEELMPHLLERPGDDRQVRIWCAGCSSGEEPYTAAMVLTEAFPTETAAGRIRLLATDISTTALAAAVEGEYAEQKLAGVPQRYRKFLSRTEGDRWRVSDRIRSLVLYKRLNLMNEIFPFKRSFDVIFCRNVMIYFDQETRRKLLAGFYRHMAPGASLFIGHSETLGRDTALFRYVKPTIYART